MVTPRYLKRLLAPALCAAMLFSAGCTSAPQTKGPRYDFPTQSRASQTLESWFANNGEGIDYTAPVDKNAPVEQLFALGEVAFWDGDVERAGELYARMLQRDPGHALNRFAAARLYALRDELVDYHKRMEPVVSSMRMSELEPLARVYLSLVAQSVAWNDWQKSDAETPFSGDALGFPSRWMSTPVLSHWRLMDFDREFEVEKQDAIADKYLSPYVAEDEPVNYERARPFIADGINLSPDFDDSGLYYLETFATVVPDEGAKESREFLLYTSFAGAATVWIDGQKVIERDESDYSTSKRLRRIELSPGQHRILVKFAYQRGYRDWFDFALLADDGTPLTDSGLIFSEEPDEGAAQGSVELLSEQMKSSQLEPVMIEPERVEQASDTELYLTASAAYMDLEPRYFSGAWKELMRRHESFASGYKLRSKQVQTLWEVPSRIRDSRSLADIRKAHKLQPRNVDTLVRLVDWLRSQGTQDREVRQLLETARDAAVSEQGRLRNIEPLVDWADWLSDQGWSEPAEKAWAKVVELAPTQCRAARELQSSYYRRSYYPELEEITSAWEQCPDLQEKMAVERPDQQEQRLALYRKRAYRYPYDSSSQVNYAEELVSQGREAEAKKVLMEARERMPWSLGVWNRLANRALAEEGVEAAAGVLEEAISQNGNSGWLQWRLAMLRNEIPLQEVMHDGIEAAKADVADRAEAKGAYANDDAYYVIDFAARKYFPDGSALTLTHTLVRAMTKNAIDRFGEFSAPDDARLVLVRTIKQDGSTRVPEQTPGKSTLSMPGLAPGDFVETAYLQYEGPSEVSNTRRDGMKFFFRMGNISSLHSEYMIIGPDGEFMLKNRPPEPKKVETKAGAGVHFVRKDSPRPRSEPATVSWEEFLPWIQLYKAGTKIDPFDVQRRSVTEQLRDSMKMSRQVADQVAEWRAGLEPGTQEEVEGLFYRVAQWFPDPSMTAFHRDVSHAIIERDGNPLLVLKKVYDLAGIPAHIYMVKSKFQTPDVYEMGEFSKYRSPLLKVQQPDGSWAWVSPDGPDAMFDTVGLSLKGQPAVCVSCEETVREKVPTAGFRDSSRQVDIDGQLDANGTLTGTMRLTFHGIRAQVVRSSLRGRTDKNRRRKFVDAVTSGMLAGATMQSYEIRGEETPDEPLVLEVQFERASFARQVRPGIMQVETTLFPEPIASGYAELPARTTPMMVRYQRDHDYAFHVKLPEGWQANLRSQDGTWKLDGEWGQFSRSVGLTGGSLGISSSLDMPIQRVQPAEYKEFQKWAVGVERSALLFLTLQKN